MATRRKQPARPTTSEGDGFPQWEHGQFTFEGEIERLGAIGRNLSTAPRWARILARVMAVMLMLPLVIGLLVTLVRILVG